MEPIYWLENEDLLRFFHRHKTEMSLMEKPQTFLRQLRDHYLVTEDRYKKVSRMKSKDNIKKGIYEILDWLERERSQDIREFWKSVFSEVILYEYPTLQLLRNKLKDGSFQFDNQLPERGESEESDRRKKKGASEDEEGEETQANSVKRKRKLRRRSVCDDNEEQAGPSSGLKIKKSRKVSFSSPLKKGEENDIWNWPIYKHQLPVTCGHQEGTLNRHRLAQGDKCIVVGNQWFTPGEFERFAGRERFRNWKMSIRCRDTTLGKLIQKGHLVAAKYKGGRTKAKKSLFPSGHVTTDDDENEDDEDLEKDNQVSSSSKENSTASSDEEEEEEEEEQIEQQPEASPDNERKVFRVTCGGIAGTLHKKRFASGTCGKSIRTEMSWMTPVEFLKEASCPPESLWKKDIQWEGKPLANLIEANILRIHQLSCPCRLCTPDSKEQENQKNDDECWICKSEEGEELVVCDHCPRSFHQKCHLPHIEDTVLGDDRPWMCTFCVFRISREWLYRDEQERNTVMSCQISQCMLQCQYLLLYLFSADEEHIFATNPCLHLKDYSTVIKTPMWLGHLIDKLQKQLYQTVSEFVDDIQLIFTNCASYNQDKPEFFAMGNSLKELFDREFKSVFNIREQSNS